MVKKRAGSATVDIERLFLALQSPDETVRGDAVRSLCPCHAGWELFEQHVGVVLRSFKDRSHVVRAHALHVFEDANRIQFPAELEHHLEVVEEMAGRKRASRYRPAEAKREARRRGKFRRRGGRLGGASDAA